MSVLPLRRSGAGEPEHRGRAAADVVELPPSTPPSGLPVLDANRALDLCLRVGEVLLSSGAGAADVTATMQLLGRSLGLRRPEVDLTFTSLSMSHQPADDDVPVLATRQVKQRTIDYQQLTQVDHLVRDIARGVVDLEGGRTELARIVSAGRTRPRWAVTLGWGVMCGALGLQLGGDVLVIALAFVTAMVIDRMQLAMTRRRMPAFYLQVAGGAIASLIAVGAAATTLPVDVSLVVTANIIMLLAGIGFMGAFQDALSGFYITAGARITEAVLATAGIIAGVGLGLSLASVVGVTIPPFQPVVADLQSLTVLATGSGLCACAFAWSSYAPARMLVPVALVAGFATLINGSIQLPGVAPAWSVAFAALFVGLVGYTLAARLRVPPLVLVVSAVVPMLPGLSIYRGLTLLSEGGYMTSQGLLLMVGALGVALALSAGVLLGEHIAQPLKREARRMETRLAGPQLIGPVRRRHRDRS